ncbi:MAG: BON domain-containing protein [Deltaproteobacteria bacterium]|nr:BON domain-containing protein [Deltaproteobacteria bacterium]
MKLIPLLVLAVLVVVVGPASAQDSAPDAAPDPATETVKVAPKARDHEIETRLENILAATKWFPTLEVRVEEGVVFLEGATDTVEHATWAGGPRASHAGCRGGDQPARGRAPFGV